MSEEQNIMPPAMAARPEEPPQPDFLKKDLMMAAIIGFLCALFIMPIFQNLAPQISFSYSLGLIIALPLFSILGMWLAGLLAKFIKVIYQIAKFVLVGALNTFLDWGVLNLLIFLTTIASGPLYSVFKGISFLVAVINSYFWNKFWTFKKSPAMSDASTFNAGPPKAVGKEFLQFFLVSAIGFAFNVGLATLIVNVWGPHWGLAAKTWANIGALGGTLVGLVWNFLGYKLIVFKR